MSCGHCDRCDQGKGGTHGTGTQNGSQRAARMSPMFSGVGSCMACQANWQMVGSSDDDVGVGVGVGDGVGDGTGVPDGGGGGGVVGVGEGFGGDCAGGGVAIGMCRTGGGLDGLGAGGFGVGLLPAIGVGAGSATADDGLDDGMSNGGAPFPFPVIPHASNAHATTATAAIVIACVRWFRSCISRGANSAPAFAVPSAAAPLAVPPAAPTATPAMIFAAAADPNTKGDSTSGSASLNFSSSR